MKLIEFLILGIVMISVSANAQVDLSECQVELPKEVVEISIDQDIYLANDQINFVAYVFTENRLENPLSKVLYVEVYDELQKSYAQEKFEILDGKVMGHVPLPTSMSSGYYFVRAYTNYGKNFEFTSMGHKVIKFINPFVPGREVVEEHFFHDMGPEPKTANIFMEVVSGSVAQNRRKVELKFNHLPPSLNKVSVTARHILLSQLSDDNFSMIHLNNEWLSARNAQLKELKYLPENRGLSISGHIESSTKSEAKIKETCILSLLSDPPQIHLSETDENGNFRFVLKELEGKKKIRIGIKGRNKDQYSIRVDRDFDFPYPKMHNMAVEFDSIQHPQYEELFAYQQLEREEMEIKPGKNGMFNLGEFDLVRSTDDYIKLTDLREIFLEIIPNVIVGSKDGRNTITVFDKDKQEYHNDPLVLLDYVPVTDYNALLDLKAKHIADLSINYSRFHLGEKIIGGIVSIRTIKNDFGGFPIPTPTAYFDYNFGAPTSHLTNNNEIDYSLGNATRSPDLRTTLVWLPEVNLNSSSNSIEFYTSDIKGLFEIKVEGYNEQGEYFFNNEVINVK